MQQGGTKKDRVFGETSGSIQTANADRNWPCEKEGDHQYCVYKLQEQFQNRWQMLQDAKETGREEHGCVPLLFTQACQLIFKKENDFQKALLESKSTKQNSSPHPNRVP